jgi:hypothetical protein
VQTKKYVQTVEAEVPVLDTTKGLIIEVLDKGDGDVLLNGVLLAGARLVGWNLRAHLRPVYHGYTAFEYEKTRADEYEADIRFGDGSVVKFKPKHLQVTEGKLPRIGVTPTLKAA